MFDVGGFAAKMRGTQRKTLKILMVAWSLRLRPSSQELSEGQQESYLLIGHNVHHPDSYRDHKRTTHLSTYVVRLPKVIG